MEKLLINDGNLTLDDIEGFEVRVKAFIRNSSNEILMVYNNNTYQLPGGHSVSGEALEESLKREIMEETGLDIEIKSPPFMEIIEYNKNFLNTGINTCNRVYYYDVYTDELPNFDKLNLTELESRTELKINYVKLDDFEKFIKNSVDDGMINKVIAYELIKASRVYRKINN